MKKESEYFLECLMNPQREAMIHIFFGERAASKISDIPKETPLLPIGSAGVVGSGTMGGGIAMNFANAGIPVLVLDQDEKNLERGMGVIEKNYQMMVDRGRMSQEQKDMVMSLITPTLTYDDLADVDIAVEAVYENLELKQEIFKTRVLKISCFNSRFSYTASTAISTSARSSYVSVGVIKLITISFCS